MLCSCTIFGAFLIIQCLINLQDIGDGWWEGRVETTGEVGLFPESYVEVCSQSPTRRFVHKDMDHVLLPSTKANNRALLGSQFVCMCLRFGR